MNIKYIPMTLFTLFTLFTAVISTTSLAGSASRLDDPNDDPALATTEPKALSNGFYIEPYFGYGYVNADSNSSRTSSIAGGAAFGYKFNDHWAVDGGYTQMPHANVSTYYLYASLKYIFPFHQSWDVFGKIGPAYTNGSRQPGRSASDEITFFADAGATYWIKPNIGLILQSAITTSSNNVPFTFNLTAGLDYFF